MAGSTDEEPEHPQNDSGDQYEPQEVGGKTKPTKDRQKQQQNYQSNHLIASLDERRPHSIAWFLRVTHSPLRTCTRVADLALILRALAGVLVVCLAAFLGQLLIAGL